MSVDMMPRNGLKAQILGQLANRSPSIAYDLSRELGEEYHNVCNALLRCKRSQLVARDKIRAGPINRLVWQYKITRKGLSRLDFYKNAESTDL